MYQGNAYDISAVIPAVIDSGLLVSRVTIQVRTGGQTADGSPASTGGDSGDGWNNVTGLIDLMAMDAPQSEARINANTNRKVEFIEQMQYRHLFLPAYYPQMATFDDWRAVVDGVIYDAIGVESDSQRTQTRLLLQAANV